MTRRELLLLGKGLFSIIVGGRFLAGWQWSHADKVPHSQLPDLIGYLLYDSNPPSQVIEEIKGHVRITLNNTLAEQLELEVVSIIHTKNFKNLSPEDKRVAFKKLLPHLLQHPEIVEIINNYLQGDQALRYLGYPELPGEFGVCGWLVLEGEIWDKYYPPSE